VEVELAGEHAAPPPRVAETIDRRSRDATYGLMAGDETAIHGGCSHPDLRRVARGARGVPLHIRADALPAGRQAAGRSADSLPKGKWRNLLRSSALRGL
jgi:hypothetical protein